MSLWNGFPSHSFLSTLSVYKWVIRVFQSQDPLTRLIMDSVRNKTSSKSFENFKIKRKILYYKQGKSRKIVGNPEMMPWIYEVLHRVYGHMNYVNCVIFVSSKFISIPHPNHNFCFMSYPTKCEICIELNVNLFSFHAFRWKKKSTDKERGLHI